MALRASVTDAKRYTTREFCMASRLRMRLREVALLSWSTTPMGRSWGSPSSSIVVKNTTSSTGNTTMQKP